MAADMTGPKGLRYTAAPSGYCKREPQLLRERVDGRSGPLPRPLGFEPQVADPPAPGRDDAADRAEVAPVDVLLIQPARPRPARHG